MLKSHPLAGDGKSNIGVTNVKKTKNLNDHREKLKHKWLSWGL